MKKLLLATLLLATPAYADSLMWDAPTQRVDNTPLPASEIKEYRVYNNAVLIGVATTKTELPISVGGSYVLTVVAVDTAGRVSVPSDPLSATIISVPNKPTKLIIKIG